MKRLLVIHYNRSIRQRLEQLAKLRHEVVGAKHVSAGIKQIGRNKPDIIVVGHDSDKQEGARLLRYMRDNRVKIPVVAVISPGAGTAQPLLMKLGARGFAEYPMDQARFDQTVAGAIEAHEQATAPPPPVTPIELNSNLTQLEHKLNRAMKCVAGKNQVYIQSVLGGGGRSRPRIALKCPLRGEYGLKKDVYFEWIRDVCCTEPGRCEAVQLFNATRESA